jgi:hypothetical protein
MLWPVSRVIVSFWDSRAVLKRLRCVCNRMIGSCMDLSPTQNWVFTRMFI